ncbi:MAG: hypothetical protein AAF797_16315 [Planctomycetota bacterium]
MLISAWTRRCVLVILAGFGWSGVGGQAAWAGPKPVQGVDGLVVMEAESTKSDPGLWVGERELPGYSGKGYLRFTGNKPMNGPPKSPLGYRFRVDVEGLYYLHLKAGRADLGQRRDYSNDCWVRLIGDFDAGPNPGDQHGMDAPLEMLKKDTKFYGGALGKMGWASGNQLDPGGHNNKRVAVYRLKPDETYTLVVSGRSQNFCLDRIVFRHESVDVPTAQSDELEPSTTGP